MLTPTFTHFVLGIWLAAALPDDPRLVGVQSRLSSAMATVHKEQLPPDVVVNKVREGLAKRVSPTAIAAAVERLVEHLRQARAQALAAGIVKPTPRLLQSVAEARLADVDAKAVGRLLDGGHDEVNKAQAIETLADLKLRGYAAEVTLPVVETVLAKDPMALAQLPLAIDAIRHDFALTTVEATASVEAGLKNERSLQKATQHARQTHDGRGNTGNAGAGDNGSNGRGVEGNPGKGKGLGRGKR